MISDSFVYSGDDAAMLSELQHCHVAAIECSGISSESEAGLSIGTFRAFNTILAKHVTNITHSGPAGC